MSAEKNAAHQLPEFTDQTLRYLIEIIDKLRPAFLRQLHTRFIKAVRKLERFTSFNFYETRLSPTERSILQRLGMWWNNEDSTSGDRLLVSEDSATQGFLDDDDPMHRVFPVNNTHSDMVKFSTANDDVYKTVIRCLKEIRADAFRLMEIEKGECLDRKQRPLKANIEKACLRSLAFPSMEWREEEDGIKAHKGTCQWLEGHEKYREWFKNWTSLLWILGYPGSGKSTLMRSNVQLLSKEGHIVAKFFVSDQGDSHPFAKSPAGMYRSLLYQILPLFPDHLRKLASTFKDRQELRGEYSTAWTWSEPYLRDFLFEVLGSACSNTNRPIFLFVDAIDELGYEPAQRVVTSFIDFLRKPGGPKLNLSICLSCRYSPALRDGGLAVSVDSENAKDIKIFIEDHPAVIKLGLKGKVLQELILQRADGSFHWVFTVLKKVTELRKQRESFATILTQVKEFPRRVESLREKTRAMEDWGNEEEEEESDRDDERKEPESTRINAILLSRPTSAQFAKVGATSSARYH